MTPMKLSTGDYGLLSSVLESWEPPEVCSEIYPSIALTTPANISIQGIDEGLISGTFNQKNFQELLHFNDLDEVALANVKGNVSAMVQIGSVAGAALAFVLADRIGRLWATRQLCLLWILGIVIFLTNGGRLGQVYAGRFIAGRSSQLNDTLLLLTFFRHWYWTDNRYCTCIHL
jgi:MFS family permease